MSRYQVWRCTWCGGVRLQPPEYPIATAASAEIHACSPTEGSYMIMVGYIEIEPGVVRAAPREPPNEKREILPSFHGEYPEEDLAIGRAIRDQCVEMEHIPLERIVDAYGAFCGSVHCSGYMEPTTGNVLWFTTWLLGRCLRLEKELPAAAPREPSPDAIRAFWERLGAFFDPWDTDERRVLEEALDAAYAVDGVPE